MSNKPILFYSPNCQHCQNLWNVLKEKNILDHIHKVNIHKNKIPSSIQSVPCLVVKGRGNLTGQTINLFFNSYTPPQRNTPENNLVQSNNTENSTDDSIKDFLPCEMGSNWSDNYSYIDNNNPINHSYSFLSNTDTGIPDITAVQNQSKETGGKTGKNDDISKRMESMKSARDQDMQLNRR
jgi:hypothetical protein